MAFKSTHQRQRDYERRLEQDKQQAEWDERHKPVSDDELQRKLENVKARLEFLKRENPRWAIQTTSQVCREIRLLDKERDRLLVELSRRGKLSPGPQGGSVNTATALELPLTTRDAALSSFDEMHGLRNGVAKLEAEMEELRRTLRLTEATSPGSQAASKIISEIQRYETTRKGMLHEQTLQESHFWRVFGDRFMELAREEQRRADVITKGETLRRMDKVLRISCNYQKHPEIWVNREKPEERNFCLLNTPPHGLWGVYTGALSENFRERVRLCVTQAGRALPDYPEGTDPEDFWLHRLYLDLLKNNSDSLFCASEEGGMILSVCVASTTFCARLERHALAHSEPGNSTEAERLRTGRKQSEPSRVQNNGKTAEAVENDSVPHAEEWRRGAEPSELANFVSFSVPAGSTREQLIHEVARRLGWRVEPLPEQLRESSYSRGRAVFGSASDILDQIAAEYKNMYWAEKGGVLRFAVKNTPVEHSSSALRSGASYTRKAFLTPILEKKGFSVHDWANAAGVDWHTADSYLNGKTRPYKSTRKKLANALGIGVEELPA